MGINKRHQFADKFPLNITRFVVQLMESSLVKVASMSCFPFMQEEEEYLV